VQLEKLANQKSHVVERLRAHLMAREPDAFDRTEISLEVARRLLALGREAFKAYADFPGTSAVWWARFERVAHWFAGEEAERRKRIVRTLAEIRGKIEFPIEGEPFTLAARADRIDLFTDGTVGVLDYKTGAAPSKKQVEQLLSPQLPLEAAMLAEDPDIARTVITHRFPIEDAVEAFRVASDKSSRAIRVVLEPC